MRLFHRAHLFSAIVAGLVTFVPLSASAQPDEEETEPEGETAEEEPAEGETAEEAPATSEPEDEPPAEGTWGVGGTEEEGRYRPRGKTGKLKELEEQDKEERERFEGPAELPPPGHAFLDTVIGFGSIVVAAQDGATSITPTASFVIGAGYRIGDTWEVFARFPISTGASDGPIERPEGRRDPDTFKQIATGALELGVRPHFSLMRDLTLPAFLSVTFPTAAGDMFAGPDDLAKRGQAIVNQAAAASRGYRDRALFAYKRFGVIPGLGVVWSPELGPGKLEVRGDTKVEIMIKTGGADPPIPARGQAQGELRSVAVNWVLAAGAAYHVFDSLLIGGLDTWISYSRAPEVAGTIDPGGAVWVFEPFVGTHVPFTESKSIGLDAQVGGILPAAGELAGSNPFSARIDGLRIKAGLFF